MAVFLDIFSDPICPWCMIGKSRLDKAERARGGRAFVRRWRVFLLDPTMPPEGAELGPLLARKFGGEERARAVYDQIAAVAEADGLGMRFDLLTRRPNTIDAHRVLKFVEPLGNQDATAEALFDLYFRQGADISDQDVLVAAAEAGGLEPPVTRKLLEGSSERQQVLAEAHAAAEAGVRSAPTFIIGGRHVVPGAVDIEVWLQAMSELQENDLIDPPPSVTSQVC